jgi:hypothetical protein
MTPSRDAEYRTSAVPAEDGTLDSRAFADSLVLEDGDLSHQSQNKKGA